MPVGPQNYPVELLSLTEAPAAEGSADPRSAEARPLTHPGRPPPSDARGARLALGPRPLEADLRGRRGTQRRRARRCPRSETSGAAAQPPGSPGLRQQQLMGGFPPAAEPPAPTTPSRPSWVMASRSFARGHHRKGSGTRKGVNVAVDVLASAQRMAWLTSSVFC